VAESGKGDAKTRGSRSEAEIVGHRDERGQIREFASTHCFYR
jgi:hypothetical protein